MSPAQNTTRGSGEPIAVVGSGFRLPGSSDTPSKLWDLLLKPRDLLTRIPDSRFNPDTFYHPNPSHHGTSDVKDSYFLDQDPRHFDANFFNIKAVEAHAIDPQQRLLLEVVYESLEASGMTIEALAGSSTGVYVGLMCADYAEHLHHDIDSLPTYTPTGTARSIMSNRISYFFDWRGPCMTIDTACSSSLVAVHQAAQLLRSGDANVAVAAGANLILGPIQYIGASKLHMLSADSRSRMWDIDASGYARGEGVAAVVLKRLSTAIADGDTIECIIRESGVNQDGRTKGITMPSSTAQAQLIASTYAKAGLDPKNPLERCQYFEAHGTGTAAGDPIEAEAISRSFFHAQENIAHSNSDPLYVGSIKTVVGHTEGTAGLAGLIKASLALRHGIIPPNYLFNTLHPAIEPFYTNLKVLTSPAPWPELPEGVPRRASVNSFGFGGTNAHVILENYVPEPESPTTTKQEAMKSSGQFIPFNFSAASEKSLRGILVNYAKYLEDQPTTPLHDLAYTLYGRRSEHAVRASISAQSGADLKSKIDGLLEDSDNPKSIGIRAKTITPGSLRVLGVFTGQGAQWATMGRELVRHSPRVRKIVEEMDDVLQALPTAERPDWTILQQLECEASDSRLSTALVAQPLCTVIQIILCELLEAAGVRFDAVVGHSSGEIAAAYAAGFLSRDDALRVAYYRGFFTNLTPSDNPGGMIAVGTSAADAYELCDLPNFQGRITVAAINSPDSVTLSGDLDAINEAKEVLDDEKKFARVLKVDKAYHSAHMVPCSKAYVQALGRAGVKPRVPDSDTESPVWFSSTHEGRQMRAGDADLAAQYWSDNMVQPVLFSQAVTSAATRAPDVAIELGPHATLKGPASQSLPPNLPYTGMLSRGKHDVGAASEALGFLWSRFAPCVVDFSRFDSLISRNQESRNMIPGLPRYQWDHERIFWHETRLTKVHEHSKNRPHPLLGLRTSDVMDQEMRWKNNLRRSELPWIAGHALQGQIIYPATAYLATAVEAARQMVPNEDNIAVIEVEDFNLGKALAFKDDDGGIETLFTLSNITQDHHGNHSASFTYHGSSSADSEALSIHATGRVIVTMSDASSSHQLPARSADPPNTSSIEQERFYSSLEPLGYGYSGPFKTLDRIRRRLNFASATIQVPEQPAEDPEQMLLHPALLDSALQVIFLAYCWPGDGSLDQLHVPTGVKKFRVSVPVAKEFLVAQTEVPACARLTDNPFVTRNIDGDIDIYAPDGAGIAQFEGVKVVALAEPSADHDQPMFSHTKWDVASPDPEVATAGERASAEDYDLGYAIERVCIYYMKELVKLFPKEEREALGLRPHFHDMFDFYHHVLDTLRAGARQASFPEWLDDTEENINDIRSKYGDRCDIQLAFAIGENLPAVLRGETTILEHMTKDGLLGRFYADALCLTEFSTYLSKTVKQISHRYPRMKMLEIGAGTGGATKLIMNEIGRSFSTYAYTDISTGFFEKAQEVFAPYVDKMTFKTLNAENDVVEQGFEEHAYDVVVASLVLHATSDLYETLSNIRRLLKPGGYLIMTEITNNDASRMGFLFGALPGWWLGSESGRKLSPCIAVPEWHDLLLQTGFGGVFSSTPDLDATAFPMTVIVSQAVDDSIKVLQDSLSPESTQSLINDECDVVLVGGQTWGTIQLIEQMTRLIGQTGLSYTIFKTLGDVDVTKITEKSAVLLLSDLDDAIFRRFSPASLEGLQKLFVSGKRTALWITQGCQSEEPYMSMSLGLGRTLVLENPDLKLQFLDVEPGVKPSARQLVETLLSLRQSDLLAREGKTKDLTWTYEHELALVNGRVMVPRLCRSSHANNRYNSARRAIYETTNPQNTPVRLSVDKAGDFKLTSNLSLGRALFDSTRSDSDPAVVQVSHALLTAVSQTGSSSSYLVYGAIRNTGQAVVALSDENGSLIEVPRGKILPIDDAARENVDPQQLLRQLYNEFQVESIISITPKSGTLLVFEPSAELASCIEAAVAVTDITTWFITTSAVTEDAKSWVHIGQYAPERVVKSLLPPVASVFVNASTDDGSTERLSAVIESCLPPACRAIAFHDIKSAPDVREPSNLQLRIALGRALKVSTALVPESRLITVDELVGRSSSAEPAATTVVDWESSTAVPIQLSTIDNEITFKGDRTYVLFGLTSDLAQSICDWMVAHGAKNIILTSRTPRIDPDWTKLLARSGVRVEAFANDITDKEALSSLVAEIRRDFPPIAGIAHGAMVLHDTAFCDMSFEKMVKVLRPKVNGATYLDELFQDTSLDFFVMFSSITAVAGNHGQSAYTAANMYMTALAAKRRSKGLAASILHIGAVMGVGYVNRQFREKILIALRRTGYMMMSEREFHLCFGEAVLSSHPLSEKDPEVVSALGTIQLEGEVAPSWGHFSRFQNCIKWDDADETKAKRKTGTLATKHRLLDATTPEDVMEIMSDALFTKLQAALVLSADQDKAFVLSSGTDNLGIDSLIAVEIRTWFDKEVDTEIPVFKILSGDSVAELLEYAVENLPRELVPNVVNGPEQAGTDKAPSASVIQAEVNGTVKEEKPSYTTSSATSEHATLPHDMEDSTQFNTPRHKDDSDDASLATPPSVVSEDPANEFGLNLQKIVPLSPGQSRFWFLKNLLEDQTAANNTILVQIEGEIRLGDLATAVQKVGARHEALRTSFRADDTKGPVQVINMKSRLRLETISVMDQAQVREEFEKLQKHPYDLQHGDCMRLVHLAISATDSYLLIGTHHIIMDGASLEIFLSDLQKFYNGQALEEPILQYSDYSQKVHNGIATGALQEEIKYWKTEFAVPPEPLPLLPFSASRNRAPLSSYGSTSRSSLVKPALAKQITETCRNLKANIYHFYLSVFEVLLLKLFGTSDVCIGMADANRLDDKMAKSIGLYLNLLPLRFKVDAEQAFEHLIKTTRKKTYMGMANSKLPFDVLLDSVDSERSVAYTPLFQAFINYRQGVNEFRRFGNTTGTIKDMALPKTGYDISLDIMENPGHDTRITFLLQESLYSDSETQIVLDMYFRLLEEFSSAPKTSPSRVSLLSPQQVNDAVQLGRGPTLHSVWPKTLVHRIDEVIAKNPSGVAITETAEKFWTYKQLDEQADRIASFLVNANIKPKESVAVFQESSYLLVASLLAVMRIGAIYVPLDSNIPSTRLDRMISECKPSALLVCGSTCTSVRELKTGPAIVVDVANVPKQKSMVNARTVDADDPAAILFTSGSTGVPKGVVLSHGGFLNHIEALTEMHGFGSETVLQQSSVGFDMSLNQVFMALSHGGNLVIVPEALRKDARAVSRMVLEHKVTYTSATPSEYLAWLRYGSGNLRESRAWTYATAGGEAFSKELWHGFRQLKASFSHPFHAINAYGPTEGSMSATEIKVNLDGDPQQISAGTAVPNVTVYVVDAQLNPLPAGFVGEICIAGAGVAIEYSNNPGATAAKFVKDPHPTPLATQKNRIRMYRTGDRGILRENGTLELLGRIDGDTQIKLRGLRIELQDIEESILDTARGTIKEVIVSPRGSPTILVAHAILSQDAFKGNETEFLRQLAATLPLPQYMRPAVIAPISAFPLTSSGKIDRRALKSIPVPAMSQVNKSEAGLTDKQSMLADVWKQVLPQQVQESHRIDATSDFFHVGGNSMILMELRERLGKVMNVQLSLLDLFGHSTLGAMAAIIHDKSSSPTASIDWEAETEIPSDFSQLLTSHQARGPDSHRSIVLTGATGFLGKQLLRQLIEDSSVDKVICIAVRDSSKLEEFTRSQKVIVHPGDLSSPRCGLSQALETSIFSSSNAIIHNGADVSFLKTYDSLRAPNLSSTKELARLAVAYSIPLHFISTASVGKFAGSDSLAPKSLSQHSPGAKINDAYAASKWASEVFLEKVHTVHGVPIFIHRPSSITGRDAGETDIVANLLRYAPLTQALPDTKMWNGFVDLVSIEKAGSGIVDAVLDSTRPDFTSSDVRYLHHAGERVIPASSIRDAFEGAQNWSIVSMRDWAQKAVEKGMNPLVGEYLRSVDKGQELRIGQLLL